jgi:hypothetical protein
MSKYIGSAGPYGVFEKQIIVGDSLQTEFDLIYQVGHPSSILVSTEGVLQEPSSAYTISEGGRKIVFSFPPLVGERVFIIYLGRELSVPAVSGNFPIRIRLEAPVLNGLDNDFNLLPYLPVEVQLLREEGTIVFLDGVELKFGTDWTLDVAPDYKVGNVIQFTSAPNALSVVDIYVHGIERSDIKTVDPHSITGDKLTNNITIGGPTNKCEAIYVKNLYVDTPIASYQTGEVVIKTHNNFTNSESHILTAAITTLDNSPTIIWDYTLFVDSMMWFEVDLVGYNVSIDENVWIHLKGGIKRKGGVASIVGLTIQHFGTDSSDYTAYAEASGTDLQIKVVGHPTNSINWGATIKHQSITYLAL